VTSVEAAATIGDENMTDDPEHGRKLLEELLSSTDRPLQRRVPRVAAKESAKDTLRRRTMGRKDAPILLTLSCAKREEIGRDVCHRQLQILDSNVSDRTSRRT